MTQAKVGAKIGSGVTRGGKKLPTRANPATTETWPFAAPLLAPGMEVPLHPACLCCLLCTRGCRGPLGARYKGVAYRSVHSKAFVFSVAVAVMRESYYETLSLLPFPRLHEMSLEGGRALNWGVCGTLPCLKSRLSRIPGQFQQEYLILQLPQNLAKHRIPPHFFTAVSQEKGIVNLLLSPAQYDILQS
jgi:hypothetical protein